MHFARFHHVRSDFHDCPHPLCPQPHGLSAPGRPAHGAVYLSVRPPQRAASFILRIEDTDQEREVPGAVEKIYDSLRQAGLTYDEGPDVGGDYGPYIQTERKDLYLPYAKQLVESGHAYYCFCTKERAGRAPRAQAEAQGETFKYDKHCLHLLQGGGAAPPGRGRALRHPPERAHRRARPALTTCSTATSSVGLRHAGRQRAHQGRRPAHLQLRQRHRRPPDGHHPRDARHRIPLLRAEVQPALRGLRLGRSAARTSTCPLGHDETRTSASSPSATATPRLRICWSRAT